MTPAPWGHKVTVHIYVPGDLEKAVEVGEMVLVPEARCEFVGTTIDQVTERPKGMGDG